MATSKRTSGEWTRFSEIAYRGWRTHIPFTNRQVIDALFNDARFALTPEATRLRALAYRLKHTDRLSGEMVTAVKDHFMRICVVCGIPARRKIGWTGRCVAHRRLTDRECHVINHTRPHHLIPGR